MPKSRAAKAKRKKLASEREIRSQAAPVQRVSYEETEQTKSSAVLARQKALASSKGSQSVFSLAMSGMVALGCWGFAYTFTFMNDPNRYLFVGMAALIALMWSISFFVRLRRWQRRR